MHSSRLGPSNSRGGGDGRLSGLGDAHLGDLSLCGGGDRDGDLILLGSGDAHRRGGDVDLRLDGPATAWNEAYIMLVSCIDYALDMTCIQSVSQCFIVCGIL